MINLSEFEKLVMAGEGKFIKFPKEDSLIILKGFRKVKGKFEYKIIKPCGKKVSKSDLVVKGHYLHIDLYKYRSIGNIGVVPDKVSYMDDKGFIGLCSPRTFVRMCPYRITPLELYFLNRFSTL